VIRAASVCVAPTPTLWLRSPLPLSRIRKIADPGVVDICPLPNGFGRYATVRIRRPDSGRLHALARQRRTTAIEAIHSAVEALERQEFLRGLKVDYQRLQEDPEQ